LVGSFRRQVNYFWEGSKKLKPMIVMPGLGTTPIKKEHGGLSCPEKGKLE
jgi:hypothetical protein